MGALYRWTERVSESKINYWATYVVDLSLAAYFLGFDVRHHGITLSAVVVLFATGIFAWTLTEYTFHRWMYHNVGINLTREGHEKHHENPKMYIAMPWFVTPLLFVPVQLVLAEFLGLRGVSTLLSGWFVGFVAYGLMHHSLHHYKLPFVWYRRLAAQHRIHHAFPETNYGVTMRYWDRVFGTQFTKPVRSATADVMATDVLAGDAR
jgi:sterol desaturase/sphingolipid hydroxylase (fatty acid hydroxylase superfamily)